MKVFSIICITASLIFALMGEAVSGGRHTGKVTQIVVEPTAGDYVLISTNISAPLSGAPSCATNNVYHFAASIVGDAGGALLSALFTAYSTASDIRLHGIGTCNIHSNVETIESIRLQ